jgi:hypothetical protein
MRYRCASLSRPRNFFHITVVANDHIAKSPVATLAEFPAVSPTVVLRFCRSSDLERDRFRIPDGELPSVGAVPVAAAFQVCDPLADGAVPIRFG